MHMGKNSLKRLTVLLMLAAAVLGSVPAASAAQPRSYTLTFLGDCTLGSNPYAYYARQGFVKTVGENYAYPFANVISFLEEDDLTLLNLEGPLCDSGNPVSKRHTFRGPTAFVNILTENSVEAVSVANNHTLDYGQQGYDSTKAVLTEAGIPFAEQNSSVVLTLEDGLQVGIYASTYETADREDLKTEITALKEQGVDVIIYAPHWGVENTFRPTEEQRQLGQLAIDCGAHIVWGSHPHVLQPIEEYGGGVILYSMGNFSFGGNGAPKDFDTALVQQQILVSEDGTVTLGERTLVPCSVSSAKYINNFQPTPYAPESAEYLRVLSKLDGSYAGPNLPVN